MKESPKQPDASDSDRAQNSALIDRLMRRNTRPAGMIDARHPRQLQARSAGWVARRFALLDHWRTRYVSGDQELNASGELLLTTPAPPLKEIGGTISQNQAAVRAIISPPAETASGTAAPPLLRVSRRPPNLARLADSRGTPAEVEKNGRSESMPPGQVAVPSAPAPAVVPTEHLVSHRSGPVTTEISAGQASRSKPNLIWRKSAGGKANDEAATAWGGETASPLPLKIEAAANGTPILARQINAGSGVMTNPAPAAVSETSAPAAIDTARLAEQVGRMLSRRLAVERERRGMK